MRKLLIPLDGSSFAEEALSRGLALFPHEKFRIFLLHCIDLNDPVEYSEDFLAETELEEGRHETLEENHRSYLRAKAKPLESSGHEVQTVVKSGAPDKLILHVARKERVDCVVLTSHGRTGLHRLINGSVAESVSRKAPCPVLIIGPLPEQEV